MYLEPNSPADGQWRKSFYNAPSKRLLIAEGIRRGRGSWRAFYNFMKKVLEKVHELNENGNFNAVRYSVLD